MAQIAALFKLTPQEAVDALKQRNKIAVTYNWQEAYAAEHAHQFTVSRLANADILQALYDGILNSVGGDLSRTDWLKNSKKLLQDAGWWGEKELTAPDGKVVKTTFNPARLQLIYDINTRQAYAAGQWQRLQETKKAFPYLRYVTRLDEKVRASHRAWHNVTLPIDDAFFKIHYPPNGWRCRCRVVAVSRTEYEKGLSPTGEPLKKTAPAITYKEHINKTTGEIMRVPVGIDPGFEYNAGIAAVRQSQLLQVAADKINNLSPALAKNVVADMVKGEVFASFFNAPKGYFPIAILSENQLSQTTAKTQVALISEQTMLKQLREHAELSVGEYAEIQRTIDFGQMIVEDANNLIFVLDETTSATGGYVTVIKSTKTGKAMFMTSFRRLHRDEAVKQKEIARLINKQ